MKKIYSILSLLLLCVGLTAQAQVQVVKGIGSPVRDLATLTEGQQVLLFCYGPTDESSSMYKTRYAFLKEAQGDSLKISRALYDLKGELTGNLLGQSSSMAYVWTIEGLTPGATAGSYTMKLKSNTGKYVPTFSAGTPAFTSTSAATFTVSFSSGDSIVVFDDGNLYMNANCVDKSFNGNGLDATVVGWKADGDNDNANFMIYAPVIEDVSTYSVNLYCYDQYENENDVQLAVPVGGAIEAAPAWENHDFVSACDAEENPITFPYTPQGDEELLLTYTAWPTITITYKDTEGNVLKESVNGQFQSGHVFTAPELLGYELQTTEYATYTVGEEDATIDLVYAYNPANLPIVPTTVTDGEFAEDTKWYRVSIRGNKYLQYDATSGTILCNAAAPYTDAALWAFAGDVKDGFKVYNKETGASYVLYASSTSNATAFAMVEESAAIEANTYDLTRFSNTQYIFAIHGTTSYWNDFGGEGTLKIYTAADAGGAVTFELDGEENLPFKPTTVENDEFAADTKFYIMTVRGTKMVKHEDGATDGVPTTVTYPEDLNTIQWAFTGNKVDGFKIYNKAAGASKVLWADAADDNTIANATALVMTDAAEAAEPNTFALTVNGEGFAFQLKDVTNAYINDFGGGGKLKFWVAAAGATDAGGCFVFTEVTDALIDSLTTARDEAAVIARKASFNTYICAENCVNGWTAEQLADIKQHYAAEDWDACEADTALLNAMERIAFDATKQYVFISAANNLMVQQPGKMYAAYANDNVVGWKELADEETFSWSFEAASDTTYYLKNGEKYIGVYGWGVDAPLVAWAENTATDGTIAEGLPAPFELIPSEFYPAAYILSNNYGTDISWLTMAAGELDGKLTSGNCRTYKVDGQKYGAAWRLMTVEDAHILTGIETVVAAPGAQTNVIYDLSGRRVQKAAKGLYIVNGKKVFVK